VLSNLATLKNDKTNQADFLDQSRPKDFDAFPTGAQTDMAIALTIVAEGQFTDIAKPLKGFGSGVFELALKSRGDAFRVVYAVQIGDEIWVLHAFQKKSKTGIKRRKLRSI